MIRLSLDFPSRRSAGRDFQKNFAKSLAKPNKLCYNNFVRYGNAVMKSAESQNRIQESVAKAESGIYARTRISLRSRSDEHRFVSAICILQSVVRSGRRRYRRQSVGFVPKCGWYRGIVDCVPSCRRNSSGRDVFVDSERKRKNERKTCKDQGSGFGADQRR